MLHFLYNNGIFVMHPVLIYVCVRVYMYNMMLQCGVWTICVCCWWIYRNPHNSSDWDFCVTRQLGYKTPSFKLQCPQKNLLSFNFYKNITCLSVGPLMMAQVFLSPAKLCVVGFCCCLSNLYSSHTVWSVNTTGDVIFAYAVDRWLSEHQ